MKKLFFRLGVTVMLTPEEFALVSTGSKAAHDLIRGKVEQDAFKLDGESYSPANTMPCGDEYYHSDDIEFEF